MLIYPKCTGCVSLAVWSHIEFSAYLSPVYCHYTGTLGLISGKLIAVCQFIISIVDTVLPIAGYVFSIRARILT